ncbi:MAG: hypothetical protein LBK58_12090, partial [Prevotellaceae bacterium]|nr:hypothetical protein [Prevotellaceae bacterium]
MKGRRNMHAPNGAKKERKEKKEKKTLFERINRYLELKHRAVFGIILLASVLFSILLFDAKINMMGDDSDYIMYGYRFADSFSFPGFRGPFYPILLSPFIAVFGINIVMLKALSGIMITGSLFLMYRAFYGRIPALILFSGLLLAGTNAFLLFYSSAVLSEPLFLLLQSLLILLFCRYFVDAKDGVPAGKQILQFLVIALTVLCLTLTRTVGYAAAGVIAVYFLFFGQWKKALMSIAANAAVFGLFGLMKKLLWPASGSAYDLSAFFTRDMYNPDRGMEDFAGIAVRLFENSVTYLSRYIYQFLGLRTGIGSPSVFITLIIVFAFLLGGYMAYRKNRLLFFAALHTLGFCLANFIILHATWMQERFIIVYYPLILTVILAGVYYLLQANRRLHFLYIALVAVFFAGSFSQTLDRTGDNAKALKMYLSGNILYGLSPDWQNYIQASRLAAKEAPESAGIAARKPSTSMIYANRPFHGIYSVPSVSKDTLNTWRPGPGKTAAVIDLGTQDIPSLSEYLTFVAVGNTDIGDLKFQTAGIYEINPADSLYVKALADGIGAAYTQDYMQYSENFLKTPDNLL